MRGSRPAPGRAFQPALSLTAGLAYTGFLLPTLVPVAAAVLLLARQPAWAFRRVRFLVVMAAAMLGAAVCSSLLHQSPYASIFIHSLVGCLALMLILALPGRPAVMPMLFVLGGVTALLLLLAALGDPGYFARKSLILNWHPAVPPAPLLPQLRGSPPLNAAGIVAAIAASGFLCGMLVSRGGRRWWMAAMFLVCLVALFLSGARTALVGFGAGAAMAGLLAPRWRLLWLSLIALTLLGALLLLLHARPGQDVWTSAIPDGLSRVRAWTVTAGAVAQAPVTGTGVNSFPFIIGFDTAAADRALVNSHNSYLQIWLDLGLLGVAPVVIMIGSAVRRLVVHRKEAVSRILLVMGTTFLVCSFFESLIIGSVAARPSLPGVPVWPEVALPLFFAIIGLAHAVLSPTDPSWH
jgi:hypothetical protein